MDGANNTAIDPLRLFTSKELLERGDKLELQVQMAISKIKHLEKQISEDKVQIKKLTSQLMESEISQGSLRDENRTLRTHLGLGEADRDAEAKLRSKILNDLKSCQTETKQTVGGLQTELELKNTRLMQAESRLSGDSLKILKLEGRNQLLENVIRLECSLSDMHDLTANMSSHRANTAVGMSESLLTHDMVAASGLLERNSTLATDLARANLNQLTVENVQTRMQVTYSESSSLTAHQSAETEGQSNHFALSKPRLE